jgi:hypothetical protein
MNAALPFCSIADPQPRILLAAPAVKTAHAMTVLSAKKSDPL